MNGEGGLGKGWGLFSITKIGNRKPPPRRRPPPARPSNQFTESVIESCHRMGAKPLPFAAGCSRVQNCRLLSKRGGLFTGSEPQRLPAHSSAPAPSGFMYALSLSALHDLMAIVETCPTWHPGDGAMGGLLACAGRALDFDLNRERGNYFRPGYMPDSMPAMDVVRAGGATVAGLYGNASNAGGEYPLPAGETRVTVYPKLKSTADMALVYDAFYTPFGWPPAATVLNERNHHSGEERCHYANSTWQWLQDAR